MRHICFICDVCKEKSTYLPKNDSGFLESTTWAEAVRDFGWRKRWIGLKPFHVCPDCVRILREPDQSLFPGPKPEAKP